MLLTRNGRFNNDAFYTEARFNQNNAYDATLLTAIQNALAQNFSITKEDLDNNYAKYKETNAVPKALIKKKQRAKKSKPATDMVNGSQPPAAPAAPAQQTAVDTAPPAPTDQQPPVAPAAPEDSAPAQQPAATTWGAAAPSTPAAPQAAPQAPAPAAAAQTQAAAQQGQPTADQNNQSTENFYSIDKINQMITNSQSMSEATADEYGNNSAYLQFIAGNEGMYKAIPDKSDKNKYLVFIDINHLPNEEEPLYSADIEHGLSKFFNIKKGDDGYAINAPIIGEKPCIVVLDIDNLTKLPKKNRSKTADIYKLIQKGEIQQGLH